MYPGGAPFLALSVWSTVCLLYLDAKLKSNLKHPHTHPPHPRARSDYWSLARLGRGNGAQKGGAKSRSRAAASSMRGKIPSWLCQWTAHLCRVDKGHLYPSKNGGLGLQGCYLIGWGKNICILGGNRGQGKTRFKEVQRGTFQRSDQQQPVPVAWA